MRDELVALAQLAKMDDSAREIDAELKQIPQQLEDLRLSVQSLETMLAQERRQIDDAVALQTAQGEELQERIDGLGRARKKMAQASSVREADAAEREVNANRRAIKEREDEVARIKEAVEAKRTSLQEREKDFEEAKSVLQTQEEGSKSRVDELQANRETMMAGRDDILARISPNTVKRYERLRRGFSDVVSIVADGNCVGCRMALPPQLFIELQRAEQVHQCPHCRRIVIYQEVVAPFLEDDGESFEEPEATAAAANETEPEAASPAEDTSTAAAAEQPAS